MARRLSMAEIDTILTLHKARYSNREIAALLGKNRETIGRHLARAKAGNQPNAPTGNSLDDPGEIPAESTADAENAGLAGDQPQAPTEANARRGDAYRHLRSFAARLTH